MWLRADRTYQRAGRSPVHLATGSSATPGRNKRRGLVAAMAQPVKTRAAASAVCDKVSRDPIRPAAAAPVTLPRFSEAMYSAKRDAAVAPRLLSMTAGARATKN